MYCHFCGKPLPENAIFCPSCGARLEQTQPNQENPSGLQTQKNQLELPLLGEKAKFEASIELYVEIRTVFSELADELSEDFSKGFYKKYGNMDNFIRQFPKDFPEIFRKATDLMYALFSGKKIFGVTQEELTPYTQKYCANTFEVLQEIQSQYQEILKHQEGMRTYREVRKNSRGRLVGGGFGISGAAKGIVTAGAVNATAGMIHSLGNAIGNMGSAISASNAKDRLFNSGIVSHLKYAIQEDILGVHFVAIDVIFARTGEQIIKFTPENEAHTNKIYDDLEQSRIPPSNERTALIQMLQTYPFKRNYYELAVRLCPDRLDDLREFATFFQYNVDDIYREVRNSVDPAVEVLLEYQDEFESLLTEDLDCSPEDVKSLTTDLEDMLYYFSTIFAWAEEDGFYFLPEDDDEGKAKLRGARSAYAHYFNESVMFLYDATLGKSGKDGFLVTNKAVYIKCGNLTERLLLSEVIEDIHLVKKDYNGCSYLYFGENRVHLLHSGQMVKAEILDEFMEMIISMILFLKTLKPKEKNLWDAVSKYLQLPGPPQKMKAESARRTEQCQSEKVNTIEVCYCFECGAENSAGDKYCIECGAELL